MVKGRKKIVEIDTGISNFPQVVDTTVEEEEPVIKEEIITEKPVEELSIVESGAIEREKEEEIEESTGEEVISEPLVSELEMIFPEQALPKVETVEETPAAEETLEESEPSKQYTICPFCKNEDYKQHGSALESSWCTKCGKCFEINWHEE